MRSYTVTVRTSSQLLSYTAIAASSFDVHDAALDRFGPCSIVVVPQGAKNAGY